MDVRQLLEVGLPLPFDVGLDRLFHFLDVLQKLLLEDTLDVLHVGLPGLHGALDDVHNAVHLCCHEVVRLFSTMILVRLQMAELGLKIPHTLDRIRSLLGRIGCGDTYGL